MSLMPPMRSLDSGLRRNDERDHGMHRRGGGHVFSYQSLMPAGAGTPRYENETWSLDVFGCGWCHPSPLDSRFRENDEFGGRG